MNVRFVGFTLTHHPQRVGDTVVTAHPSSLQVDSLLRLSRLTCTSGVTQLCCEKTRFVTHWSVFVFRQTSPTRTDGAIWCKGRFGPARPACVGRRQSHLKFPLRFPALLRRFSRTLSIPSSCLLMHLLTFDSQFHPRSYSLRAKCQH